MIYPANRRINGKHPFIPTSIILLFCLFFTPEIANAAGYSISGTGNYSTSDGFGTNISTFATGAACSVSAATSTGSAQTTDIVGLTGSAPARWSGTWRVNAASSTGSVYGTIIFDFSAYGAGVSPGTASGYMMMYRLHSGGAWTYTGSGTISGNTVSFSAATIPNTDNDFTLGTINQSSSPLPVTWLNFEALYFAQAVELKWSTASEVNNSHFEIERSTNGIEWTNIGQVGGHGTSNVINSYAAIDNLTGVGSSESFYYRLKQVDFNNLYQYSWMRSVNILTNPISLQAFPNPATNILNIIWISTNTDNAKILRLVNATGVNVFDESIPGEGEMNTQINMAEYPAGVYILQIISDKGNIANRLVLKNR